MSPQSKVFLLQTRPTINFSSHRSKQIREGTEDIVLQTSKSPSMMNTLNSKSFAITLLSIQKDQYRKTNKLHIFVSIKYTFLYLTEHPSAFIKQLNYYWPIKLTPSFFFIFFKWISQPHFCKSPKTQEFVCQC